MEALKEVGYSPRAPVNIEKFADVKKRKTWQVDKGMRVFSLWDAQSPYREIDVFIENPIDFEKIDKDREVVDIGEFKVPVISIDHLIKLKKDTGRKQDVSDIESLERLKRIKNGE